MGKVIIQLLISSLFLLALAGCVSQLDPKPQVDEQVQVIPITENPYLANRLKVDAVALGRFEGAKRAVEKEQWQQAEAELNWLIENRPNLSGPYLGLALLHKENNRPEQSEAYFKQAISVNANNIQAYNQYGIFLREQGEFKRAEMVYQQALEIWPDSTDTHRNLGVLYDLYLGNQKAALAHYYQYQKLTAGTDRLVSAWIIDLERQLMSVAQGE